MKVFQNKDLTLIAPDIYPLFSAHHVAWPEGVDPIPGYFPTSLLYDESYNGLVKCGWPNESAYGDAFMVEIKKPGPSQLYKRMKHYIGDDEVSIDLQSSGFPFHVFDNEGFFFMPFNTPVHAHSLKTMEHAKTRIKTEALK